MFVCRLCGCYCYLRDHSCITSAKGWVSGVRKWQFLLIYSTVYADVGGWVGLKSQKHADVILEWSLTEYFDVILMRCNTHKPRSQIEVKNNLLNFFKCSAIVGAAYI